MPWYFFSIARTWRDVAERSMPNQVLSARPVLVALASLMANALLAVHGSARPNNELKTGPYLLDQSVREIAASLPLPLLTVTVTVRRVIATGCPFWRYSVGCPGARVS